VTAFDYAVLAGIALSVLLGFWRGVVSEVLALAAWVLAIVLGKLLAPSVAPELARWIADAGLQYLASFAAIVVVVLLLVSVIRVVISGVLKAIGLGLIDRFLGAIFGAACGILVVLACVAAGGLTSFPKQAWWRDAILAPPLETAVVALKPWLPQQWAGKIRYHQG
jgi:membrane protein required for colicin V production